jgi:hypothetical protein
LLLGSSGCDDSSLLEQAGSIANAINTSSAAARFFLFNLLSIILYSVILFRLKGTCRSGFLMKLCWVIYNAFRRIWPSGAMIISKNINPAAAGYLIA